MRKSIHIVCGSLSILVITILHASAQDQNASLYHLNPFYSNPGRIGAIDYTQVAIGFINQPVEIDQSFRTASVSGYVPIEIGLHKLVVGGIALNDRVSDFMDANGGAIGAALRLKLNPEMRLGFGSQLGFYKNTLGFDLTTDSQYVNGTFNSAFPSNETIINDNTSYFALSSGLYWQLVDYLGNELAFVGGSIFNYNQPNRSFIDGSTDRLPVTYKGSAGIRVLNGAYVNITPNIQYQRFLKNNIIRAGTWVGFPLDEELLREFKLGAWYNTDGLATVSLEFYQYNFFIGASYDQPISSTIKSARSNGIVGINFGYIFYRESYGRHYHDSKHRKRGGDVDKKTVEKHRAKKMKNFKLRKNN
ncbi:MAG: PorP/SprF family type IX secretion system membrane protein [Cyclobacteriaceae bacterium]